MTVDVWQHILKFRRQMTDDIHRRLTTQINVWKTKMWKNVHGKSHRTTVGQTARQARSPRLVERSSIKNWTTPYNLHNILFFNTKVNLMFLRSLILYQWSHYIDRFLPSIIFPVIEYYVWNYMATWHRGQFIH